jgi:hypothetical protein
MRLTSALTLVILCALAGPAAADKIKTSLQDHQDPAPDKVSELAFVWAGCEEECHVASLTCDQYRSIGFTYADVDAAGVAKAIRGKQEVTLAAGGKNFAFTISRMEFSEMTGTWWLDSRSQADPFELLTALSGAKSFKASRPGHSLTLPVTADLVTWAKACRGTD